MKKNIYIIVLLLLSQFNFAQTTEEQLERLKIENDSLRFELEKCQFAPAYTFLNIEKETLKKSPCEEPLEDFRKRILKDLKLKSEEKFLIAKKVIAATDDFFEFRKDLKNEMIERTGGIDEKKKRPVGIFDKKIVEQVLIKESKGDFFKNKIEALRELYLSVNKDSEDFSKKIILSSEKWKPNDYVGMPFAAFLPIPSMIQKDAEDSERVVLKYLNE